MLHFDGEVGPYLTSERSQRFFRAEGLDFEALSADGRLTLSAYPSFSLDDDDCEEQLVQVCAGYDLVIMDSLRAFSGALDENKKEIGVALLMLARVSFATGAVIMILHHNRKAVKGDPGGRQAVAGNNAIVGGSEGVYLLDDGGTPGAVAVTHDRTPTGRPLKPFGLVVEDVPQGNDPRWGLRIRHQEGEEMARASRASEAVKENLDAIAAEERVRAALIKNGGSWIGGKGGLRAQTGLGSNPFTAALGRMTSRDEVREEGSYHRPIFRLNDHPNSTQLNPNSGPE